MQAGDTSVLLIAYGNPGRRDDGLGPALATIAEGWQIAGFSVDSDYQLSVEHAFAAAQPDVVVFADAAIDGMAPFFFEPLEPAPARPGFSSHGLGPAAVLALARELFGRSAPGWLLGIRGYEFDQFGEGLSHRAERNLHAAARFLEAAVRGRRFSSPCQARRPRARGTV